MKKIISAIVAVAIIMSMSIVAFAAGDTTIKVKDGDGIVLTMPGRWNYVDKGSKNDNTLLKKWGWTSDDWTRWAEERDIYAEVITPDEFSWLTLYIYGGYNYDWSGATARDLKDTINSWPEDIEDFYLGYDVVMNDDTTWLIFDYYIDHPLNGDDDYTDDDYYDDYFDDDYDDYDDEEDEFIPYYLRELLTVYNGNFYWIEITTDDDSVGIPSSWDDIAPAITFKKGGVSGAVLAIGGAVLALFLVAIILQARRGKKKRDSMAADMMGYNGGTTYGANTYTDNTATENTYRSAEPTNYNIYTSAAETTNTYTTGEDAAPGTYTNADDNDGYGDTTF